MGHIHEVIDSNGHFKIDAETRIISNASGESVLLIQNDHNSERLTFELPRRIDEHDMSLCNRVEVHYINIGADGEQIKGVYVVDDLATDIDTTVTCSWLISANATQLAGTLSFLIRFACLTGETIDYAWHTEVCNGITVSNGMNNGEAVVAEFHDVLEAWKQELFAEIETQTRNAIEEIKEQTDTELTLAKEVNPRAMIRQICFYDKESAKSVRFEDVYSVFDVETKQNGNTFGLEAHGTTSTQQRVFISRDGGLTWEVYGTFTIDAANGVWFTDIFVDQRSNIILLLKTNDGFTRMNNEVCSFMWNGEGWWQQGTLNIGAKRWLGNNNSIDVCSSADWTSRAIIFGEYGTTTDGTTYSLYKTTNNGVSWKKVLECNGDSGGTALNGEIRHWHTVQVDPYTKYWWATSGDGNGQCKIFRSTDMGETWELMFSGSQRERTCGFVFEEDCIYYGMDSTNNWDENSIKIVKIDKSKLETDRENSREDVAIVDSAFAVYGLSKVFYPDGFIVWSQQEPGASYVKDRYILQFYDYGTKKLYPIARIDTSDVSASKYIGFYAGARIQSRYDGVVFAKPTACLQQDKLGSTNVSTHIRLNITC